MSHGGMGHHGGGGGHHSGMHAGHGHGFLSHLFGQHHNHVHHTHGVYGHPDSSVVWNMAMQAEKPNLWQRLVNSNGTPIVCLVLLLGSMIFWLWLVDILHQHEQQEYATRHAFAAQHLQPVLAPQNPALNNQPVQAPLPAAPPVQPFAAPQAFGTPELPGGQQPQQPAPPMSQPLSSTAQSSGYQPQFAAPPAAQNYPMPAPMPMSEPSSLGPAAYHVPVQTIGGPRMRVTVNR